MSAATGNLSVAIRGPIPGTTEVSINQCSLGGIRVTLESSKSKMFLFWTSFDRQNRPNTGASGFSADFFVRDSEVRTVPPVAVRYWREASHGLNRGAHFIGRALVGDSDGPHNTIRRSNRKSPILTWKGCVFNNFGFGILGIWYLLFQVGQIMVQHGSTMFNNRCIRLKSPPRAHEVNTLDWSLLSLPQWLLWTSKLPDLQVWTSML